MLTDMYASSRPVCYADAYLSDRRGGVLQIPLSTTAKSAQTTKKPPPWTGRRRQCLTSTGVRELAGSASGLHHASGYRSLLY